MKADYLGPEKYIFKLLPDSKGELMGMWWSDTIGKASLQEPCPIQSRSILTQKAECDAWLIPQSIKVFFKKCQPNMMIHDCFFNLS